MNDMSRYINPYTDFGFKKLFGEEGSKDLLIDFLNAVLPAPTRVADLTFRPSEQLPDNIVDRKAIYDIACISPTGDIFTVEMQKASQTYFRNRALFYAAFPIQKQAQKGNWDFKLNPVFLVAILDFEYDQEQERRELRRLVTLKDQNGEVFVDTLQMVFLQMPMFNKTEAELVTQQDKWLYFLKNLESFGEIPAILNEPIFDHAFEIAEWIKYPSAIQEAYRNSQKAYWDNTNTWNFAMETAEAKGRAEGKTEEKTEIARNMKKDGVTSETIAKYTGLSPEEIFVRYF